MIIHKGYENISFRDSVVTIGMFDGVHRGHATLLNSLINTAKKTGGDSIVITFAVSGAPVIGKGNCLTTADEKRKILREANISSLVELDEDIKAMTAVDFIKNILVDKIGAKHIITGYDQRFGWRREGDFEMLKRYSADFGFTVERIPEFIFEGEKISSSAIREALLEGDVEKANRLLGYDYKISGTVVEGKKIGREIGFPTANIAPDASKLIPANGVYAVEVATGYGHFPGALNIGIKPTISPESKNRTIEVNIIGFDKEIYGETITLSIIKKLRNEKRFNNIEDLILQMQRDKEEVLRIFS